MIEHYILLGLAGLSFLFSVDKNRLKLKGLIWLSTILFFLYAYILVVFRDTGIGNDTNAYVDFFYLANQFDSINEFFDYSRFEKGYVLLNYLISRITEDYTLYFIIFYLIYFICTIRFFREFSFNKTSWILPWFLLNIYYSSFNVMRAAMALAFVYLFVGYFLKGKRIKAIISYIVAFSMHVTAIPMGIVFVLKNKYIRKILSHEMIFIIGFGIIGAFFSQLLNLLPDYYANYANSDYASGSARIANIADFILVASLYFLSKKNNLGNWDLAPQFRILFMCTVGMSFLGIVFPGSIRIEEFFKPFALIYVLNTFQYQSHFRRIGIVFVFIGIAMYQIIAFIIRPEWLNIFPYSFR